ncbi:hypothetical protein CYMTET_53476 [Cymbomonas tetramitiformis]|uniref:Uncharacterized protein n=1 Tax=Cymbomonas tetramitiformis TaxID=36881 RepID=A0AAE0BGT5_9CHLO|nr:hypothetical protein CYMTET_53476 [Cymbomonas tetramitiformis]
MNPVVDLTESPGPNRVINATNHATNSSAEVIELDNTPPSAKGRPRREDEARGRKRLFAVVGGGGDRGPCPQPQADAGAGAAAPGGGHRGLCPQPRGYPWKKMTRVFHSDEEDEVGNEEKVREEEEEDTGKGHLEATVCQRCRSKDKGTRFLVVYGAL